MYLVLVFMYLKFIELCPQSKEISRNYIFISKLRTLLQISHILFIMFDSLGLYTRKWSKHINIQISPI